MPYKSSSGLMVAKDKISYDIPADRTVGNLFDNLLTTVIKPGVDIFDKKSCYEVTFVKYLFSDLDKTLFSV